METLTPFKGVGTLLRELPDAMAIIRGSESYPGILGYLHMYQLKGGVLIAIEVIGLPNTQSKCKNDIFALHLHEGKRCSGNATDPFADAKTHYNPNGCEHPYHAGDLPPLFGNGGYALSIFVTDRFAVQDVIGKTVIIHAGVDDFTSQPAGNAGAKIACGVLESIVR